MDWFLYDKNLPHERVKKQCKVMQSLHMFKNKQLYWKIPFGEKTEKPAQNSM